jgi:hypothetical protein
MHARPRTRALVARLVAAGTVVLILGAGLLSRPVHATEVEDTVTVSQHELVQRCKDAGGTSQRIDTHIVKCTWQGGSTTTCNFDTKQCITVPAP